jgi:hypothetical protein
MDQSEQLDSDGSVHDAIVGLKTEFFQHSIEIGGTHHAKPDVTALRRRFESGFVQTAHRSRRIDCCHCRCLEDLMVDRN